MKVCCLTLGDLYVRAEMSKQYRKIRLNMQKSAEAIVPEKGRAEHEPRDGNGKFEAGAKTIEKRKLSPKEAISEAERSTRGIEYRMTRTGKKSREYER